MFPNTSLNLTPVIPQPAIDAVHIDIHLKMTQKFPYFICKLYLACVSREPISTNPK